MHVRRHEDAAQGSVEPQGQAQVGMVEQGRRVQHHFEHHHGRRRRPQGQDQSDLDRDGQQDFQRVKTHARGRINGQVRVMHPVQAPQHRNVVNRDMLGIDGKVHQQQGNPESRPAVQPEQGKQPPALPLISLGRRPHRRRHGQEGRQRPGHGTHGQGIDHDQRRVARPPLCPSHVPAARPQGFRRRHGDQHADEASQPQQGFMGRDEVVERGHTLVFGHLMNGQGNPASGLFPVPNWVTVVVWCVFPRAASRATET